MERSKPIDILKKLLVNQPIFILLVCFIILAALFVPNFATVSNFSSMSSTFSYTVLAAIGMTFVILNGGIDFSVVAIMNLCSVIGAIIMNESTGLLAGRALAVPVGIVVMLLIGLAIGCLNAFSVVILKMPSFMATMATNLAFSGIALFITESQTIMGLPKAFRYIGTGNIGIIPFSVILAIIAIVIMHIVLSRTVLGRQIYAVGTNHQVAFISGISVKKTITWMFLFSGFFAAVSGIVVTSWMGAGRPTIATDMQMDIVSAVIIGGTSSFGGEGKITGTVVGTLLIVVMTSALSLLGLSWYVINAIKGLILLGVAFVDAAKRRT